MAKIVTLKDKDDVTLYPQVTVESLSERVDSEPKLNSNNLVLSGGVKNQIGYKTGFELGALSSSGTLSDSTVRMRTLPIYFSSGSGSKEIEFYVPSGFTVVTSYAFLQVAKVKAVPDFSVSANVISFTADGTFDNIIVSFKAADDAEITDAQVNSSFVYTDKKIIDIVRDDEQQMLALEKRIDYVVSVLPSASSLPIGTVVLNSNTGVLYRVNGLQYEQITPVGTYNYRGVLYYYNDGWIVEQCKKTVTGANVIYSLTDSAVGEVVVGSLSSTSTIAKYLRSGRKIIMKKGERFMVSGSSGSVYPMYIIEQNGDVVRYADSSDYVVPYSEVLDADSTVYISCGAEGEFRVNSGVDTYDKKVDKHLLLEDISSSLHAGAYMSITGDVDTVGGSIVATKTSNNNTAFADISVSAGDIYIVSCRGGNASRAYVLLDDQDKLINIAVAGETVSEYPIICSEDGRLIVNATIYQTYGGSLYKVVDMLNEGMEDNDNTTEVLRSFASDVPLIYGAFVTINESIGETVAFNLSTVSGDYLNCAIVQTRAGDTFLVKGRAGSGPKLIAMLDREKRLQYVYNPVSAVSDEQVIKFTYDGYLVVNVDSRYEHYVKQVTANNIYKNSLPPMLTLEPKDFLVDSFSELSDFTFFSADFVSEVFNHYDTLLGDYSNTVIPQTFTVTKVDLSEEYDITEPSYMTESGYHMYMYKILSSVAANSSSINAKKKLFIFCGVHGNEQASSVTLYFFLKRLLQNPGSEQLLFNLLHSFDFYIIPLVNVYGTAVHTRANGNGIDINRNFPTIKWTVTSPGETYSGTEPGSEFETKILMAALDDIKPDIGIDFHNYGNNEHGREVYVNVHAPELQRLTYQHIADCSYAMIAHTSGYFNNKSYMYSDQPIQPITGVADTSTYMNVNCGMMLGTTLEINCGISWVNGEHVTNEEFVRLRHTQDAFRIAEYQLRSWLSKLGTYALSHTDIRIDRWIDGYTDVPE